MNNRNTVIKIDYVKACIGLVYSDKATKIQAESMAEDYSVYSTMSNKQNTLPAVLFKARH